MGEIIRVSCKGCREGCQALPLTLEFLQEIAEKQSEMVKRIIGLKVFLVYCHQKGEIQFGNI